MRIKFCGITRLEDAQCACDLGVDALGFILYPPSPRAIGVDQAALIAHQVPPFVSRVAVVVNPTADLLGEIASRGCFDVLQLHGDESPEFCASLAPRRLIKAVGLPRSDYEVPLSDYPVTAVLLDKASVSRGGTGETIDWQLASTIRRSLSLPVILSGGLNPHNVRQAAETVQPYGVDVCSGIEDAPGIKNHQHMREFYQQCRP